MSIRLFIWENEAWREVYSTDAKEITLGREEKFNQVVISNDTVSRNHAKILMIADEFFCIDQNSSNGTFINEVPLEPFYPYHLQDGDILRLSNCPLKFESSKAAEFNGVFFLDENLSALEKYEIRNSLDLDFSKYLGQKFLVTVESIQNGFLVKTNNHPAKLLLPEDAKIISASSFELKNPSAFRIEKFFVSLSKSRQEEQASTQTRLLAVISSSKQRERPVVSDQGTVLVQSQYFQKRQYLRSKDTPFKHSVPILDFKTQFILIGIIVLSLLLSIILVLWVLFTS